MRPRLRRLLLAAAALIAAGIAGALAWLTLTQSGLDRVVALVESLDGVHIRIDGARGRLAGPLQVDRFEFVDDGAEVVALGIAADYEPSSLAWGSIAADALSARQVVVRLKPKPADDRPPRFLPAWLRVSVDAIDVPAAEIRLAGGQVLALTAIRGSLRLGAARLDVRDLAVDGGTWSAAGAMRLEATKPLGLSGDVAFTAGRGREVRGAAKLAGDLARLDIDGRLDAPLATRIHGQLLALDEAPRWEARLDVERLDPAALAHIDFVGPLAGQLAGAGTFKEFALQGTLAGSGLPSPGARVQLELALEAAALRLRQAGIQLPATGASLAASGTLSLTEPRQLDLTAQWRQLRWPLAGAAAVTSRGGRLELAGDGVYRFSVSGFATPGTLPELQADARGTVGATEVEVTHADVAWLGGRGTVAGKLRFDRARAWRIRADLRDLDPGQLRSDLSGRLALELEGSGAGLDERAQWRAELRSLRGTFRRQAVTGRAAIDHRPGRTSFERALLTVGPARFDLEGRYGDDTDLKAALDADDLSRLLPELGGRLHADLQARTRLPRLRNRPSLGLEATVTGTDLRWGDYRAARIGVSADIDLTDRDASWVRLRTIGVDIDGRKLQATRLSVDGTSRDHAVTLRVGIGDDAVELEGRGALTWPRYALHVAALTARGPRDPGFTLAGPFDATGGPEGISVTPVCFRRGDQRVCAVGDWSATRPWQASLSAEALPLGMLGLHLPAKPTYRGRLDAHVAVTGGPAQRWIASGIANVTDATFSYRRASGREVSLALGLARLDLAATPDRYLARFRSQATAATFAEAEVTLPRDDERAFADLPITGTVHALTRELGLLPLFVPQIDRAAGELRADLDLAGTLSAPLVTGNAQLRGGEIDLYQTNLRLRDLAAAVQFTSNRLRFDSRAALGAGTLAMDGTLGWQDRVLGGEVSLRGEQLLVANVPEARVVASPDLRFRFAGATAAVAGTVRIPEARIAPGSITNAVFASGDERLASAAATAPAAQYKVQSQLTLTLGKKVYIDAFGLKGQLTGSVDTAVDDRGVATGTGEFEVEAGRYSAYSRELEVEHGRLLFAGGPLGDPGVDLRATREVPGYEIGVNVRGRLRRPEITFFSDPPLSQTEIASMLLVGRQLNTLTASDSGRFSVNKQQVVSGGGSLLAGQLGRYVGVDDFGVEAGPDDYSALVIGKYLSPRLYISYGISLAEQINTLKLRYTVGDQWKVNLESGAAQSLEVEYTIER